MPGSFSLPKFRCAHRRYLRVCRQCEPGAATRPRSRRVSRRVWLIFRASRQVGAEQRILECVGRVVVVTGGAQGHGPQVGQVAVDKGGERVRVAGGVGGEELFVGAGVGVVGGDAS